MFRMADHAGVLESFDDCPFEELLEVDQERKSNALVAFSQSTVAKEDASQSAHRDERLRCARQL